MVLAKDWSDCALAVSARKWKHVSKGILTLADMIESSICLLMESLNRLLYMRELARSRLTQPTLPEITGEFKEFQDILDKFRGACVGAKLPTTRETVGWAKYHTADLTDINAFTVYQYTDQIYGALVIETSNITFFKLKRAEYYSRIDDADRKKMFGDKESQLSPVLCLKS